MFYNNSEAVALLKKRGALTVFVLNVHLSSDFLNTVLADNIILLNKCHYSVKMVVYFTSKFTYFSVNNIDNLCFILVKSCKYVFKKNIITFCYIQF